MTQKDITAMLRAYNQGLMTSGFEHYEFVAKLAGYYNDMKEYYKDISKFRYELDDEGFYKDNYKLIKMLERRIDILQDLIDDMEYDFIKLHKAFK